MDVVYDKTSINAEEDKISNLPNEIIHHILSFLDMKYVIQTSTLSKKWKYIWTSMPHINLNSRVFRTFPRFAKFVNDALSHRNHRTEVSAVELLFRGGATQFDAVVTSITNYAYSHNVRQLSLVWFRFSNEALNFPQRLFNCHTLKHLTLATHYYNGSGLSVPKSAWDFPALETLNLSNLQLGEGGVKSLDLFSKCVNLKDLTLHQCGMFGVDIINVCAPQLSNLTITDPITFAKVFNVVAPQLENLTASVSDLYSKLLQLSTEGLDSLQKVNLSMRPPLGEKERFAPGLLDLFQKLCRAKFLILDMNIIQVLSACLDQLSDEPCPFNSLKCLKQKDGTRRMPIQLRNYLLESSPNATFSMDLPQVPQKRSREEADKGTMAKKCLNQTDRIPRMPTEVKNQLPESSPSATFDIDSPQVPHKRSRQETDNGTMANTLEEEKQQTKIVDEKKRMLETKIFRQDEVIAKQKVMLESMKLQHEERMLEAKIEMQDKIIAQQKAMLEATKLQHEIGMLEEKMQMQDKVIVEQKMMLETMKLQNDKKMLEAKILRQDEVIAQQKAMLMEGMKLQHEKIQTKLGNNDN